jgi:hypothetical protein
LITHPLERVRSPDLHAWRMYGRANLLARLSSTPGYLFEPTRIILIEKGLSALH